MYEDAGVGWRVSGAAWALCGMPPRPWQTSPFAATRGALMPNPMPRASEDLGVAGLQIDKATHLVYEQSMSQKL